MQSLIVKVLAALLGFFGRAGTSALDATARAEKAEAALAEATQARDQAQRDVAGLQAERDAAVQQRDAALARVAALEAQLARDVPPGKALLETLQ